MWPFWWKGASGFSARSTAEEVTRGIDGTALTAIVTGLLLLHPNDFQLFYDLGLLQFILFPQFNFWVFDSAHELIQQKSLLWYLLMDERIKLFLMEYIQTACKNIS